MSDAVAPTDAVEIIAHRGYSARAPENTLAAFEAAVAAGADAVEFDIHTAACGTPVIFHDTMLSRTTNAVGPIRRRTLGQLKGLDAGAWFSRKFMRERIPSLQEGLATLRGHVGRVYAEIKGFREMEDLDRILRVTADENMLAHTCFISLKWTALDRLRSRDPGVQVGYIVDDADRAEEAIERCAGNGRSLVDYRARLLLDDPELARRTEERHVDMAVWTVNDPGEASRLYDEGVRRFTTNEVDDLLAWKRRLPAGL